MFHQLNILNVYPCPQQQLKRLKLKRKDVQQLITRGQQLQSEEGLGETLQQDLQSLENTLSKMEQSMDSQEQNLEVSTVNWTDNLKKSLID